MSKWSSHLFDGIVISGCRFKQGLKFIEHNDQAKKGLFQVTRQIKVWTLRSKKKCLHKTNLWNFSPFLFSFFSCKTYLIGSSFFSVRHRKLSLFGLALINFDQQAALFFIYIFSLADHHVFTPIRHIWCCNLQFIRPTCILVASFSWKSMPIKRVTVESTLLSM